MSSPEELAREKIDALLQQCGWILQDRNTIPDAIATSDCIKLTPNKCGTRAAFLKYAIRSRGMREKSD